MSTILSERELADQIRTRGYWEFVLRPATHRPDLISDSSALLPIMQKARVEMGGWQFPSIDDSRPCHLDINWVGHHMKWEHHLEVWRLFRSGQFYSLSGIPWEWRDDSGWWPASVTTGWAPNTVIGIGGIVQTVTRMIEFAARLAQTTVGDETIHIQLLLGRTGGRSLVSDLPTRTPMSPGRTADVDQIPLVFEVSSADLMARSSEIALDKAMRILGMFKWNPPRELLVGIQDEVKRG